MRWWQTCLLTHFQLQQIKDELAALRDGLSDPNDIRKRPVQDIQAMLIDGLESLPEVMKEPYAEALAQLMNAMDMLAYSLKAKLAVAVLLTNAMVKPVIIHELVELAEHMMEKNVNALDSPEGIVMRIQRDVFRGRKEGDKTLNFEHELLEKLVWLRARRTGKPDEDCRKEIVNATKKDK